MLWVYTNNRKLEWGLNFIYESIWGLFVEMNQFKPELREIAFILIKGLCTGHDVGGLYQKQTLKCQKIN